MACKECLKVPLEIQLRHSLAAVVILEINIADDSDFECSGEQVNNDDALGRAVRPGKSACAPDETNIKFISSRSTARGRF